jgi:hypothetical protein
MPSHVTKEKFCLNLHVHEILLRLERGGGSHSIMQLHFFFHIIMHKILLTYILLSNFRSAVCVVMGSRTHRHGTLLGGLLGWHINTCWSAAETRRLALHWSTHLSSQKLLMQYFSVLVFALFCLF